MTGVPSCYGFYINGVMASYNKSYPGTFVSSFPSYTVTVFPLKISFGWDSPSSGIKSIPADNYTTVTPYAFDSMSNHVNLKWSIIGPDLHCQFNTNTGTVTASTNSGTITLQASDNSGNSCFTLPLELKDCLSCQGGASCAARGAQVVDGSVDIKIPLGWSMLGDTAGYMYIKESDPTNSLATPGALRYNFIRPDVEVYTNGSGDLTQIKAPEELANIVVSNTYCYAIQIFNLTNVVSFTNGGYRLTNSPFRTISITNLNADTNQLQITDSSSGGTSYVYNYAWTNGGWVLTSGNGLRTEAKAVVWSQTNTIRTVTTTIQQGTNSPVFQSVEQFAESATYGERLLARTNGTGNNPLISTYSYTPSGFIQQAIHENGSWEYYRYDTRNRPTNIFSSFLNQAVSTDSNLCSLVTMDYTTNALSGSGDAGSLSPDLPRRTIKYLLGKEIARSYLVALPAERREIRCVTPGAAWNAADNLVTITKLFTNGFRVNEPFSIQQPDGTIEIYQYGPISPNTTNIVLRGHPSDANGTNIDAGTQTFSVLNLTGQMLSQSVVDVASNITVSSESYQYDYLNRLTNTTFMDGTSMGKSYDCCTLSSETDRDGTVTTYSYDALKRLVTTTRNSITTSNAYDAYGNLLSAVRYGTNGTAITLSSATYDDAGRQTSLIDALSHTTTYTNYFTGGGQFGGGQLVKQSTYQDVGTRFETNALDGSLLAVAGTAVRPMQYLYGVDSASTNFYTQEIRLDASGGTNEWTKTFHDMVGRSYKTVYASGSGTPTATSYFNTHGQLTNRVDPDGVSTLYTYDTKGELACTILDLNQDHNPDFSGGDRITRTTND
ncbi:MAG: hypothetical protein JWR19_4594, partial [Pedosphaera sp.]|nr:hypothetical protein [Pedosphaera sp.]